MTHRLASIQWSVCHRVGEPRQPRLCSQFTLALHKQILLQKREILLSAEKVWLFLKPWLKTRIVTLSVRCVTSNLICAASLCRHHSTLKCTKKWITQVNKQVNAWADENKTRIRTLSLGRKHWQHAKIHGLLVWWISKRQSCSNGITKSKLFKF